MSVDGMRKYTAPHNYFQTTIDSRSTSSRLTSRSKPEFSRFYAFIKVSFCCSLKCIDIHRAALHCVKSFLLNAYSKIKKRRVDLDLMLVEQNELKQ